MCEEFAGGEAVVVVDGAFEVAVAEGDAFEEGGFAGACLCVCVCVCVGGEEGGGNENGNEIYTCRCWWGNRGGRRERWMGMCFVCTCLT